MPPASLNSYQKFSTNFKVNGGGDRIWSFVSLRSLQSRGLIPLRCTPSFQILCLNMPPASLNSYQKFSTNFKVNGGGDRIWSFVSLRLLQSRGLIPLRCTPSFQILCLNMPPASLNSYQKFSTNFKVNGGGDRI
jgi:hypothetical protein